MTVPIRAQARRVFRATESPTETIQKMLPLEVVAFYQAALAILVSVAEPDVALANLIGWVIFAVGLVGTPLYLLATWNGPRVSASAWPQLSIAMLAFVVWAFGLGGPFTQLWFWRPWVGGLALLAGTLLLTAVSRLLGKTNG